MLVSNGARPDSPGRTTTSLDDRLIRLLAPLPLLAAMTLAVATYAVWGLGIPLLLGAKTAWLVSFNTEGAIFAGAIVFARLFPIIEARFRRQRLELTTNLHLLSALDFEQLVGEMFRHEGWEVTETGRHGEPDGGIDLRIARGSELRLVQCKRWTARSVGVEEVRQLGGVLLAEGLSGSSGVLVTTSEFTRTAKDAAERLDLELIDGESLVPRLQSAGATKLLKAPPAPSTPWQCPKCDTPMILDKSPHGWWLHCPSYRSGCTGKRDLGSDPEHALELLQRSAFDPARK